MVLTGFYQPVKTGLVFTTATLHKDNIKTAVEVSEKTVKECLDLISGAVKIVWPMGLPHFDPVRLELENCEDLSGTQVRENI